MGLSVSSGAPGLVFSATYQRGSLAPSALSRKRDLRFPPVISREKTAPSDSAEPSTRAQAEGLVAGHQSLKGKGDALKKIKYISAYQLIFVILDNGFSLLDGVPNPWDAHF